MVWLSEMILVYVMEIWYMIYDIIWFPISFMLYIFNYLSLFFHHFFLNFPLLHNVLLYSSLSSLSPSLFLSFCTVTFKCHYWYHWNHYQEKQNRGSKIIVSSTPHYFCTIHQRRAERETECDNVNHDIWVEYKEIMKFMDVFVTVKDRLSNMMMSNSNLCTDGDQGAHLNLILPLCESTD